MLANPGADPDGEAAKFIDADKGVEDAEAALEGARNILIERIGEIAALVGHLREKVWAAGDLTSVVKGKEAEGAKFSDYFDFSTAGSPTCRRTARSPCCAARRKASSKVDLDRRTTRKARIRREPRSCRRSTSGSRPPADKWLAEHGAAGVEGQRCTVARTSIW